MPVAMQASDRAEIDHAGTLAGPRAQPVSPAPGIAWNDRLMGEGLEAPAKH